MTTMLAGLRVLHRGTALVDGVDLELAPGTSTALVGASGAGKSLTCAAIAGTLPATLQATGTLVVGGAEVLGVPAAARPAAARTCLMAQDPSTALHPLLPVAAQVAAASRAAGRTRTQACDDASTLLGRVGLDPALGGRVPGRLSGGQRQRAALALALAAHPTLLIADEPTTALDVVARAELLDVLAQVTAAPGDAPAPALLLVTHDLPAAAGCDHVVVMSGGRVVESGDAATVMLDPRHQVTRAMCKAAREETLAGALAAIEARAELAALEGGPGPLGHPHRESAGAFT